jgi:hypothetical protein
LAVRRPHDGHAARQLLGLLPAQTFYSDS